MKKYYTLILLMAFGLAANAQESEMPAATNNTKWLVELSASFGGGELGTIEFQDGSEQTILSANGLTFTLGVDQRISTTNFGVKAGVGYKYSGSKADNANVKKTAIPVDILPYYRYKNHKLGAGINYHIKPTIDWDVLGDKVVFDNALGYSLEYMYFFDPVQVSASYTMMNYAIEDTSVDANHFSIKLGFLL